MTPLLLPAPARFTPTGTAFAPPPGLTPRVVRRALATPARLPPDIARYVRVVITGAACGSSPTSLQGYTLQLSPPSPNTDAPVAHIQAPTASGARHALATLAQLLDAPALCPCEITDQPAFATRGVMLDVSRCRIPGMQRLFEIIEWLASLKINHVQLYTEHTFAYAAHEAAWAGWSPITPDEFERLGNHCRSLGIDLAPNQNCFGHLSTWLRLPEYQQLAETHGDWMFDVWPRSGPFSLCPTDPASLAFVRGLLDELLPLSRSEFVNIGCDETYDIAFGRSADEVRRRGRAAVYLEFVAKVASIAREHGKRAMFWGDIALSHPECVRDIPDDMIALAWGYEPDSPFDRWLAQLAGREVWVCPGTSSWRSLTGRTRERTANIAAAATAGLAGGATGFLICDWGDLGHWQQWPIAAHAISHAAAAAWNPAATFDAASTGPLGPWLEKLGDADEPLRRVCGHLSRPDLTHLRNQSALFADLHTPWAQHTSIGPVELWEEALATLDALAKGRPDAGPLANDELDLTLGLARHACRRAIARRAGDAAAGARFTAERADLQKWFRRLWLASSREGGLSASLDYFAKID
ncbi:MAG: family 20 glycosylhydrolase [Tepidisphaera sp.]|nr:family 20 glycosylhydrolase [Tepidisphaera sp.]